MGIMGNAENVHEIKKQKKNKNASDLLFRGTVFNCNIKESKDKKTKFISITFASETKYGGKIYDVVDFESENYETYLMSKDENIPIELAVYYKVQKLAETDQIFVNFVANGTPELIES